MTLLRSTSGLLSSLILGALAASASAGPEPTADLPPEFQQIIPRGRIASVDAPELVPAKDAEIPGDAWVLGVAVGGEARAYSLNLLNHHEVVNDRVGEHSFAAVW
ncbi:MAG: DUF3179 domain-containing protein [bacterium]|nr:DUF3179 domain-containing protein [bacterium]